MTREEVATLFDDAAVLLVEAELLRDQPIDVLEDSIGRTTIISVGLEAGGDLTGAALTHRLDLLAENLVALRTLLDSGPLTVYPTALRELPDAESRLRDRLTRGVELAQRAVNEARKLTDP
jgi:hypothetical protein